MHDFPFGHRPRRLNENIRRGLNLDRKRLSCARGHRFGQDGYLLHVSFVVNVAVTTKYREILENARVPTQVVALKRNYETSPSTIVDARLIKY